MYERNKKINFLIIIFSIISLFLLLRSILWEDELLLPLKAFSRENLDQNKHVAVLQQQQHLKPISISKNFDKNQQMLQHNGNAKQQEDSSNLFSTSNKFAIINFDDGFKGQYLYAKPVLDKFHFKATFFIVCDYVGKNDKRMNWDEINTLYHDGYDIQSHTMTHKDLGKMSYDTLINEINQSKQCLLNKGINSTIFAYPRASGSDNITVVKEVAKAYDLARTGFSPVTFLKCDGWNQSSNIQKDCRTYSDNGSLTFANRYSLKGWMHERVTGDSFKFDNNSRGNDNKNIYDDSKNYYGNYSSDDLKTFENFKKVVNIQTKYNGGSRNNENNSNNYATDGIDAVPIITYHDIKNGTVPFEKGKLPLTTDLNQFKQEMKYLRDNGFTIITLQDIGYNPVTKYLYIKG